MTINAVNRTHYLGVDAGRYPASSEPWRGTLEGPPAPASVTITGSGFGVAPNVVLYRTLDGEAGVVVPASPPEGEIGDVTTDFVYTGTDGAKGHNGTASQLTLSYVHPSNFRRYRFAHSVKVPNGYYPPTKDPDVPAEETWGTASSWKLSWFMLGANGYQDPGADLCIPTHIGGGAFAISGNTTQLGVRYWDYPASTSKPIDHWDWDEWNTFQVVFDADETNPHTTAVAQRAYLTSAQTGGTKTTGTKTYSWNLAGFANTTTPELSYFDRVRWNTYSSMVSGYEAQTMTHWRDFYLAIESSPGANDYKQACFLGNAATLADCTRIKMKVASSWSDTSVTIPILAGEGNIYTHAFVQKPDGTTVSVMLGVAAQFYRTATFDTLTTGASGASGSDGYDSLAAGASAQGNTPDVSTTRAYSGAKSLRCPIGTGDTGWGFTIGVPVADLPEGGEIWARFRCYMPSTFDSTTGDGTMKFFRYRVMTTGGVPIASHSFNIIDTGTRTGMRTFRSDVNSDNRSFTVPDDAWATWEFYLKIHASTGVLRAWCNGALVGEATGNTRGTGTMVSTDLDFLNYFNNGSPADQEVWIDQIEIALSGVGPPNTTDGSGNAFIGYP